jgi:hypothetical protein
MIGLIILSTDSHQDLHLSELDGCQGQPCFLWDVCSVYPQEEWGLLRLPQLFHLEPLSGALNLFVAQGKV